VKEKRFYDPTKGHGWAYTLALAHLRRGDRVLDLCCGAGYGCEILLQKARCMIGVDYDPEAIAWATKKHPKCSFHTCDLSKDPLPLRDNTVDFITWIEGIEHLDTVDLIMREITRVAIPGAGLFLTTPSRKAPDPRHKHYYMLPDLQRIFPGCQDLGVKGWCGSRVIYWTVRMV